jgi:hypothetical protein
MIPESIPIPQGQKRQPVDNRHLVKEMRRFGTVYEEVGQYTMTGTVATSTLGGSPVNVYKAYARLIGYSVSVWPKQWWKAETKFASGWFPTAKEMGAFLEKCGFLEDHRPIQLTLF